MVVCVRNLSADQQLLSPTVSCKELFKKIEVKIQGLAVQAEDDSAEFHTRIQGSGNGAAGGAADVISFLTASTTPQHTEGGVITITRASGCLPELTFSYAVCSGFAKDLMHASAASNENAETCSVFVSIGNVAGATTDVPDMCTRQCTAMHSSASGTNGIH